MQKELAELDTDPNKRVDQIFSEIDKDWKSKLISNKRKNIILMMAKQKNQKSV